MSLFNTREDRRSNGKPKPHRHFKRYVKRKGVGSWWKRLLKAKRRRADDRNNIFHLMTGKDPDGIIWTTANKHRAW